MPLNTSLYIFYCPVVKNLKERQKNYPSALCPTLYNPKLNTSAYLVFVNTLIFAKFVRIFAVLHTGNKAKLVKANSLAQ